MLSWSRIVVFVAAAAAAAGTARLGLWQLDRAEQKLRAQAEIDRRERLPPLTLAELARQPAQLAAQRQRRAEVEGRWLNRWTLYLDNRAMDGRAGFIVLTPLALDDGSALLVERGWVARDFHDRTRVPPPPDEPGRVQVHGRIVDGPARVFEFDSAARGAIRQNVDLRELARETGLDLRPVSLRQTGPHPSALLRDWPRPDSGVAKNHGYAFQWFALCALIVFLYVWFQVLRPRRRSDA